MSRRLWLACALAAVASPARAESADEVAPSAEIQDEIVVTASHAPRSLATTPGSVSVIHAEEIAARTRNARLRIPWKGMELQR